MKKAFVLSLASMCIALSGCSSVQDSLEQKLLANMRENSGISTDAAYEQFQEYAAQGKVADGYYTPNGEAVTFAEQDNNESQSGVKISFASNSNLDVRYYYDPDFSTQIDSDECTLPLGGSIYAKVKVNGSVTTNKYGFSSFRIYEYSTDGKRIPVDEVSPGEDGLLWHIPENFEGSDVVIEPFGKYENRVLSFQDYFIDSKSKRNDVSGSTWTVDNESAKDGTIEINPIRPYYVRYEYDRSRYFFVSSVPACYSYSDDEGIVYFKKVEPSEDITAFSVELKPYMTEKICVDVEANVRQGDRETKLKKNETYTASHLKYGDKITIQTKEACEINYNKELFSLQADDDNHCYTLTVREGLGDFVFDLNDYSYAHGEVVFHYAGQVVNGKITLAKGRRITYYAQNIDDGYWLPDGDHTIIVGDAADTKDMINRIQFYPKQEVTVSLPQPEYGGSITYSINGIHQTGNSVRTYCGTDIQMKLNAWNGWKAKYDSTVNYVVNAGQSNQTTTIDGFDVNHAFEEFPQHKPNLIVNLDKSVGSNMTFDISTSGERKTDLTYGKGGITGKRKVYEGTIGTAQGISIKAQQDELQEGKALKIVAELTDTQKNKVYRIFYIQQLPDSAVIPIYQANEFENSQICYKTIDVTISVVDKQVYQPTPATNAVVTLTAMDVENQPRIQAGDIMDDDRSVRVVIKPNNGYYATGSNVKFDQYQKDMSFKAYRKDIQSIVNKHPVRKVFTVTLDCTDDYGTVEYTLDGTPVSGETNLREGQKLIMKYCLNTLGYQIERGSKGIVGLYNGMIASKKDESVTIEISSTLDGQTIRRSDYVQVKKEG